MLKLELNKIETGILDCLDCLDFEYYIKLDTQVCKKLNYEFHIQMHSASQLGSCWDTPLVLVTARLREAFSCVSIKALDKSAKEMCTCILDRMGRK